jgi:uncharacterized membrane protein YukC
MILEYVAITFAILVVILSVYLSYFLVKNARIKNNRELSIPKSSEKFILEMPNWKIYDEYQSLSVIRKYKKTSALSIYNLNELDNCFNSQVIHNIMDHYLDAEINRMHTDIFLNTCQ